MFNFKDQVTLCFDRSAEIRAGVVSEQLHNTKTAAPTNDVQEQ